MLEDEMAARVCVYFFIYDVSSGHLNHLITTYEEIWCMSVYCLVVHFQCAT